MISPVEAQFHAALVAACTEAGQACRFDTTYVLQMIGRFGAVQTAKSLVIAGEAASGFAALWRCNRLDLSIEALVVRREFAGLFARAERQAALRRLERYGYFD